LSAIAISLRDGVCNPVPNVLTLLLSFNPTRTPGIKQFGHQRELAFSACASKNSSGDVSLSRVTFNGIKITVEILNTNKT
jgi:hypothetical protein